MKITLGQTLRFKHTGVVVLVTSEDLETFSGLVLDAAQEKMEVGKISNNFNTDGDWERIQCTIKYTIMSTKKATPQAKPTSVFTRGNTVVSEHGTTVLVTPDVCKIKGQFWGVIIKSEENAVGVLNHFAKDKFTKLNGNVTL